jgi:molybdate transport system substrate-binding protein
MKKTQKNGVLRLRLAIPLLIGVFAVAPPLMAGTPGQVRVMISGGFGAAFEELVPRFEAASGIGVLIIHGPSMGAAPQSIPNRLALGEAADVVILADSALDHLIAHERIIPASKTNLAQSLIAIAVKEGAPPPRIESAVDLARALTAARSIAVSASASGVYVSSELIGKLGIADRVKEKIRVAQGEPVGSLVARGEVDIGFQQLSELQPIKGITIAGLLPAEVQRAPPFQPASSRARQTKRPDRT